MPPSATLFESFTSPTTINVPSTWRKVKEKRDGDSQTLPITLAETACQTITRQTIETQTDPEPPLRFRLLQTYDRGTMVEFLDKVESMVSTQLLQNITSTAFDGWSAHWEEAVTSTTLLHTLSPTPRERDAELLVTDLTWNRTGSTVCVAYGRYDHESWCDHKGALCAWSLAGRVVREAPMWSVETESCVMSVAFHPENPALIAGGAFNGQVFVAQTKDSQLDSIVATSKMGDSTHQEPVAKVEWAAADKAGDYNIISVGNDGKVLTWNLSNNLVTPICGSQLVMGAIPRHLRPTGTIRPDTILGGTAISFSAENPITYIVATEPGYIAKCSRGITVPLDATSGVIGSGAPKMPNPIQFAYTPHTGPVNAVSCSPFHRNLFVSAGSDGLIRLYNVLQAKPLLTFSPSSQALYSTLFSPHRASVFAATSADGLLYIYDLAHSPSLPHTTLQVTARSSVPATALAFSKGRSEFLATGDAAGVVKVWRIASGLAAETAGREWRAIEALGGLAAE
ncbi:WD40-repeat-containing domain protein [Geranomyces variabilis]|nr:WD40-repeat-containing domain protein [Geranomyces variabilis]KAJ3135266.1 WD repeat-containing protein 34 [Geranomyces variabilis]